jgi:site-specific DNA-cytosine methylase
VNVLSLFDGISCGQVAFERAGIKVDKYYASEIDPRAIKATQKNYPNTVQMGDVTQISEDILDSLGGMDILIGGSPCQDLSAYKLNRDDAKGLEGSKSKLFYHYERIFKHIKPKYFLLENVVMAKEWEDLITEILGVEPVLINSTLVSAAERKRLYWTNIPNISQPEDKGILIKDIIVPANEVPDKYWYNLPFIYNGDDKKVQCTLDVNKGFQRNMKEVYNINGKCNTLLADGDGGNRQKKVYQDGRCRKFMPIEYERMQNLPDNYTDGVSDSARYSAVGNGWTVDVIAHIFKGLSGVK